MLPFLGQLAKAALPAVIGGVFGASGQRSANQTNIALGREQMAFQERMSSTAYQRAVMDMRSAGLNPMLAYSQGGASAPVGSMPQVQNVAAAGVSSAASALGLAQSVQQMEQSAAQTDLVKAQADRTRSETMSHELNTALKVRQSERLFQGANRDFQQSLESAARTGNLGEVRKLLQLQLSREEDTFSADVARRKAESALKVFDMHQREETFESDVRARQLASELLGYEVPRARAEGEFWDKAEDMPQWMRMVLQVLNGLSSARRANSFGR